MYYNYKYLHAECIFKILNNTLFNCLYPNSIIFVYIYIVKVYRIFDSHNILYLNRKNDYI